MSRAKRDDFDPLGARPDGQAEAERRLREAENVLASYHRAKDLLAEALQNAIDAIDARSRAVKGSPRRLEIEFDARKRHIAVRDSGTGMSRTDLNIVFQPNVTFKAGGRARTETGRSRGEKGVGLSFLMLASNNLSIETCDGKKRHTLNVTGAADWATSEGRLPAPTGWIEEGSPTSWGSAKSWTRLVLRDIRFDDFDEDLFTFTAEELVWALRTTTAVGNTSFLFKEAGFEADPDIEVTLRYTGKSKTKPEVIQVPYRYATPEDLLVRAKAGVQVHDYDVLAPLGRDQLRRRTKNGAIRRVVKAESKTGKTVWVYFFAMDGRAMAAHIGALSEAGQWVPDEWQGFYVATRNMPTGVQLNEGIISPRGYERRLFALLHVDNIKLDVGRKTLAGGTAKMLRSIVSAVWDEVGATVKLIAPAPRNAKAGRLVFNRQVRDALALPVLDANIPYLRIPDKRVSVSALFHELVGAGWPGINEIRPLTTGVFTDADALLYLAEPNGDDPLHAVFGTTVADIVEELEANDIAAETAALGVVWTLGETESFDVLVHADPPFTHTVRLDGLSDRKTPLPLVVLDELLAE